MGRPLSAGAKVRALLAFLILCAGLAWSASADSEAWAALFARANQLYEAGQYREAIVLYEQLILEGARDGRVYYNLGNAYFKSGELGEALVNYERARRLLPRDEDVRANLAFARAQVKGGPALPAEDGLSAGLRALHEGLRLDEKAWLAWGLYLLMIGLGLVGLFAWRWRRPALIGATLAGCCLCVALISFGIGLSQMETTDWAFVVTPQAPVYSGPGESYMLEITLGEGNSVRVEERRGGWCRVRLAGDLQGWTQCTQLESVREAV